MSAAAVEPVCPGDAEPVFAEPWQAQAFALTLALHARGVFSWEEWARHLSEAIARARTQGDPDRGDTYYRHWVDALECVLAEKGVAPALVLASLRQAWQVAAEKTPHGEPIRLNSALLRLMGWQPALQPEPGHTPPRAPDPDK